MPTARTRRVSHVSEPSHRNGARTRLMPIPFALDTTLSRFGKDGDPLHVPVHGSQQGAGRGGSGILTSMGSEGSADHSASEPS